MARARPVPGQAQETVSQARPDTAPGGEPRGQSGRSEGDSVNVQKPVGTNYQEEKLRKQSNF